MNKKETWKLLTSHKYFCCTDCDGPYCSECGDGLNEYEYIKLDGVCTLCLGLDDEEE